MKDFFHDHALELAIIDRNHPKRDEVEHYIAQRYSLAFDARLNCFMPTFMALMDDDHIKSLCGYRVASDEALFLEQYLDHPADALLANTFKRPVERTDRLIRQLLMLARVESIHDLTFSSINLTKLVQGVIAELVSGCECVDQRHGGSAERGDP